MDELSVLRVAEERDEVVALLRTIADRLTALAPGDARGPLARLRTPVTALAQAAKPVLGPLPHEAARDEPSHPAGWPTVVFVRRGVDLEA